MYIYTLFMSFPNTFGEHLANTFTNTCANIFTNIFYEHRGWDRSAADRRDPPLQQLSQHLLRKYFTNTSPNTFAKTFYENLSSELFVY